MLSSTRTGADIADTPPRPLLERCSPQGSPRPEMTGLKAVQLRQRIPSLKHLRL